MRDPLRGLIAGASALVVVLVAVLAGGSASKHLPRPPDLASGSSQASASHGAQGEQVYTPAALAPLTGCSLTTSPATVADQSGEVITVTTAPGAWVRLEAQYPRFASTHSGQANAQGTVAFALADPPTPVAQTVRMTATATLLKLQKTCQGTFTPQAPALGCTVLVSNPAPVAGQTTEVVTVRTNPGASVRLTAVFPRFTSIHRHQASDGTASFYLPIANPVAGYRVQVTATALLWSAQSVCHTSFTPR